MADIYISYSRKDRSTAEALAEVLEGVGWTVWWDTRLSAGESFDEIIEEQLEKAKCVIVLWSEASIQSRWVRSEAGEALEREILFPIHIEQVRVPLSFRRIHTFDLAGWNLSKKDSRIALLVDDIGRITGPPVPPESEPISLPPPQPGQVFISYSREDTNYVQGLISFLRNSGLSVWADDRIDYGDLWWETIVENIDNSSAMVVVMSSRSEGSKWVRREVMYADSISKPIYPVLLEGRVFPLLITFNTYDVSNGKMPQIDFVNRLQVASSGFQSPNLPATDRTKKPFNPSRNSEIGPFRRWLAGVLKIPID